MMARMRPTALISGRAGGVAQHVNASPLRTVKQCLAGVSMNDDLAIGDNLSHLILSIAVDVNLSPMQAGTQVISGRSVHVNPHAVTARPQPASQETVALAVVDHETLPARLIACHNGAGPLIVSFRRKITGVNKQAARWIRTRRDHPARIEIHSPVRVCHSRPKSWHLGA